MEISIELPDDVAARLHSQWQDLPRHKTPVARTAIGFYVRRNDVSPR